MSMYKTIIFNDQKFEFKISAGTEILYKRFWGQDLDAAFRETMNVLTDGGSADIVGDLKNLMTTVQEIQGLDNSDPKKVSRGLEIWSKCSNVLELQTKKIEFAKKFGYIAAMEAAHAPEEIDKYLNNGAFTSWLLSIDRQFFQENADTFAQFYFDNFKHTSKSKNLNARPIE